ncbi:16310_t:CDS:2, partial [Cetraspora pellucida]
EDFGLLAFDIKVNHKNHSINIIITYKKKLILIQYKNTKMPISVQIAASDCLGIIVYNSKKLKEKEKFATFRDFYESDNDDYVELVDYKANKFNIVSLLEENVSIEELEKFNFKHYKTVFATSKEKIKRIINHFLDSELKDMKE